MCMEIYYVWFTLHWWLTVFYYLLVVKCPSVYISMGLEYLVGKNWSITYRKVAKCP
jgi:hypothetical protein